MTNSPPPPVFDETSPSIQTHLGILQGIVLRMATNSTACKTWCITIVSAILVIVADKGKPDFIWIALFPAILFAGLDAYYLALEKGFRNSYNEFIKRLHTGQLTTEDLYSVAPTGRSLDLQVSALKSFSVWGFYLPTGCSAGHRTESRTWVIASCVQPIVGLLATDWKVFPPRRIDINLFHFQRH